MLDLIEKKNLKKKKKKKKKMKKKKKKIFFFCTTKHNITVPPIVHSVMRKDKPKKVQTPQTKKWTPCSCVPNQNSKVHVYKKNTHTYLILLSSE